MQHFDVIIIGAGISGIGSAYHLQKQCPDKRFCILERRDALGGTWDLFRYPGIRSDSDMYTLGYEFKPWRGGKILADGPAIKEYLNETAEENSIKEQIVFNQDVRSANWSSSAKVWTLKSDNTVSGERSELTCSMLLSCAGYYNYQTTYQPEFAGSDDFEGTIIHPQFWPDDLDYTDKKIVVIGSGATAVTIVPAMAERAASITMLQRSPTYMASRAQEDGVGKLFKAIFPEQMSYELTRWTHAKIQRLTYGATRVFPGLMKRVFIGAVRKELGPDYDVDKHFTPSYYPWDQRLCAVPDNDIFEAIKSGKADVKTDEIDTFTNGGIKLKSGEELAADIIITATGLKLAINGELAYSLDGEPINFSDTWSYKGIMFSGVPNLINTFGYINASWTLRADMVANFACRLLNKLDATANRVAVPTLRDSDSDMQARPWIDDFPAGYIQRDIHRFPKQGDRAPWLNTQNYTQEKRSIGKADLNDGVLALSS